MRSPYPILSRCAVFSVALLALLLTLLTFPTIASAHAHLVDANPAPNSVIAHAPTTASFLFDEPLNPTLTRVRVTDAGGRPVTTHPGFLASGHGGELWRLPLPPLRSGVYSVFWTSESATDGHIMRSFYTFRVGAGMSPVRGPGMGLAAGSLTMDSGGDSLLTISGATGGAGFFAWLRQMAQALWLGVLVLEIVVLTPARRGDGAEARLACAATRALWRLGLGALVATVVTLITQFIAIAVEGTGDWSQALAPATLEGILSSQNGQVMTIEVMVLLIAILVTTRLPVPDYASMRAARQWPLSRRRARPVLGIVAPLFTEPSWEAMCGSAILLAGVYMALVAMAGHAANVTPIWISCTIDWVHLVGTGAWIGGIAALAYGVLPSRQALSPTDRAPAILPLLDRFSPVAYLAVGSLALSGIYNALSHLHSPAMVTGTTYGHLLAIKTALVGLLIALSGLHVKALRPLIARAQQSIRTQLHAHATVHEGLATLAGRIRLEAGVGAALLLVTAMMGQTLPAATIAPRRVAAVASAPASITSTMAMAGVRARLTITPPAVGTMQVGLQLWDKGRPITAETGVAIVHLYPTAQPTLRTTLTLQAHGARFTARGSLAMTGAWRADVLVRTAWVTTYRTLSFDFTAGAGAHFRSSARPSMAGMDGM